MMSDSMQELKQMRIWFLWRWGTDKNGNPTKVPFAANGGETGTDDAHSSTWITHDDAVAAAEKYHAAGLGFKIPENYFFLDIDHRELSDPLVQTLLTRFDSYTERSVSGGGIHIYGKCDFTKLPTYIDKKGKVRLDSQFYQKNSKIDLELYVGGITNRFAAYTGNIIEDIQRMHLIADFLIRSIIRTRMFNDYLGSLTNTPVIQRLLGCLTITAEQNASIRAKSTKP